jgi:Na+/H+-dicarboxylate symporter
MGKREGVAMKCSVKYSTLYYWFIANAIITICFGLYLGMICLFPSVSPHMRALFFDAKIDLVVPYIIFALMVSSIVSMMYFYDIYRDRKWKNR